MNNTAEFADTVLMVRPRRFGYNETTAGSNHFQYRMPDLVASEIQSRALREFEGLRDLLRDEGVDVIEFDDSEEPGKPDALFPNNWFSTDPNGTIILYPMEGENRRFERRTDIVDSLRHSHCYGRMIDLTAFERDGKFLEGTGSMVFDRRNSVIYAALSSRTDPVVLAEFASRSGFREIVTFHTDLIRTPEGSPQPIYHTNVVLAIGLSTAVICTGVISATEEKRGVVNSLTRGGRTVVEITVEQLLAFAGNMLQVRNKADHLLWVMSTSAFDSLSSAQKTILVSAGSRLIHSALPTIETVGGGSARCMLAEIFRPVPHEAREI